MISNTWRTCCIWLLASIPMVSHAQLTIPQMTQAMRAISKQQVPLPNAPTSCPAVDIPGALVSTQEQLDTLRNQLMAKEQCTERLHAQTSEPKLRAALENAYPNATGWQTSELTELWVDKMEPVREEALASLVRDQERALAVGRPFVVRSEVASFFEKEMNKCEEPKAREAWTSFIAATIFVQGYQAFDSCLMHLYRVIDRSSPMKAVSQVYASESDVVKAHLLAEYSSIKKEALASINNRIARTQPARAHAQSYLDAYVHEKPSDYDYNDEVDYEDD